MAGIKPECRSRRLTARCIRRHGRPTARPRADSALPCYLGANDARPDHLGTLACHVYRTGAANGGTGPGMEWSWVMCPAGGLSASLSVTVSSRRWTA